MHGNDRATKGLVSVKIDSIKRSLAKAISWRIISLIILFFVTYVITGSTVFAISISVTDMAIKMVAYYFHERTWTHTKWGRAKHKKNKKHIKDKHKKHKHKKHLIVDDTKHDKY